MQIRTKRTRRTGQPNRDTGSFSDHSKRSPSKSSRPQANTNGIANLIEVIEDSEDGRVPTLAREALGSLIGQLRMAQAQILGLEKKLTAWHRANEASRRLETIPGVGVITATALVATIGDASQFQSGRQLAA